MGINQRVSLRKFIEDIRRWVDEGRSDDWIANALGTSSSSVQSFRSRNSIYRRSAPSVAYELTDYSSFEGALDGGGPGVWFDPGVEDDERWRSGWRSTSGVELHVTPSKIYIFKRKV